MFSHSFLAVVVGAAVGTTALAGASDDPLAAYRWKSRVLVAIAPSMSDPRLTEQRKLYQAARRGAIERDLVLVEAAGEAPEAVALRRRFGLTGAFRALLVGKDGGAKLSSDEPLGADRLFPVIDSMPMRRQEMQERQ